MYHLVDRCSLHTSCGLVWRSFLTNLWYTLNSPIISYYVRPSEYGTFQIFIEATTGIAPYTDIAIDDLWIENGRCGAKLLGKRPPPGSSFVVLGISLNSYLHISSKLEGMFKATSPCVYPYLYIHILYTYLHMVFICC